MVRAELQGAIISLLFIYFKFCMRLCFQTIHLHWKWLSILVADWSDYVPLHTLLSPDLCLAGSGHICRQNNCSSLLVQHPPGPGHQRQHPEPQLSLEAGGGCAAAAATRTSWRLGPSRCEAAQEHHLHIGPCRRVPTVDGVMISSHIRFQCCN